MCFFTGTNTHTLCHLVSRRTAVGSCSLWFLFVAYLVWFLYQSIMGSVMATLSLEARRRFSRPSFLADCRHSTARYHRSGNAYQNNTLFLSCLCFVTFNRLIPKPLHFGVLSWTHYSVTFIVKLLENKSFFSGVHCKFIKFIT